MGDIAVILRSRNPIGFRRWVCSRQVGEIQDNGLYLLVDTNTQEYALISLQDYEFEYLR